MKNKELHEFINGLQPNTPDLPQFEQRLRRTVLNQPRHRSHLTGLWRRFIKPADSSVKRRKKLVGLSSMAMVVALLLSVGIYSYRFSPQAVAEETVNQGLVTLQATTPGKINTLFSQLGGDPKVALQEAKAAKDLTVITKAEFDAESAKAPGIFASSLSGPGQPQTVAFGINNPNGAKGGAISGGNVMVSGVAATATAVPGSAGTPESAAVASGAGTVTISSGSVVAGPTSTSFNAKTGATTTTAAPTLIAVDGNVTASGRTGVPTPTGTTPTAAELAPVQLPQPSTYLRYTDKNGRTVVLSLDKDGLPIFKTIFMKASDTQNLLPKTP